ncbi:hypothetical protein Cgig2_010932 [Carnegiea gigantea]|uniref:Uncharacterized protein n=1 Tax=Carnegiea gigantea TaxID=171969 RepID=A0A9Q1K4M0_9CARY|nr:hypothetical protein Cgig2_010932 [Carnegiea gigantea]
MTDRGGIILSWRPRRYQFNMILKTDQLIHGEAIQLSANKRFYITFVYSRNLEEQRIPLWEDLKALSQSLEDPWCVLEDFNSVLHQRERIGGIEVIDGECSYEGAFFTWTNKTIWSRIDRALHNELWYEGFAYTHVHCMTQGLSNHTPVTMNFPHFPRPRNTFQFCDMWTKDKGFKDMVKHSLAQNQNGSSLKHSSRARNNLLQTQALLQQDPFNTQPLQKEAYSRDHHIAINHLAILLIKQQSKADWIGVGDECSRIFMARIKQRNMIKYYKGLLGMMDHQRTKIGPQVMELGQCLIIKHQIKLSQPFEDSDIKKVLFSIPNHKSPGPDGCNSGLYKACWEDIGPLVCLAIKEFFSGRHLPSFYR